MIGHAGLRALGRLSPGTMLSRFDWLYDHDVTAG
jgi:salicylate hydroxylase